MNLRTSLLWIFKKNQMMKQMHMLKSELHEAIYISLI